MKVIKYDQSKPFTNAINFQKDIVKSMSGQISSGWFSSVYNTVSAKSYFVVKYDAKDNFEECTKFAFTFSKYPKLFLGNSRTEMQFNDVNLTLSINDWIECKSLINGLLNCSIEYYIHTINNLPATIYFRIKNNIESCEEKLKYFINSILEDQSHLIETNDTYDIENIDDIYDVDDIEDLIVEHPIRQLQIIPYQKYTFIFPKIVTPQGVAVICLLASGYFVYQILL